MGVNYKNVKNKVGILKIVLLKFKLWYCIVKYFDVV